MYLLEKPEISCEDFEEVLYAYEEGELSLSVRARVNVHLDSCEQCQELLADYRLTKELASELRTEANIPSDVQSRLRERLNKELGLEL